MSDRTDRSRKLLIALPLQSLMLKDGYLMLKVKLRRYGINEKQKQVVMLKIHTVESQLHGIGLSQEMVNGIWGINQGKSIGNCTNVL